MLFHLYHRDGLIFAHIKQSSLILYFVKSDGLQIQFPDSTVAHGPIIYGQILHVGSRCPLGSARMSAGVSPSANSMPTGMSKLFRI